MSGVNGLGYFLKIDIKWMIDVGFQMGLCVGAPRGTPFKLPFTYGTFATRHSFFKLVAAEGHGISACNAAVAIAALLKQRAIVDPSKSIAKLSIRTMKPAITIIDKQGGR